MTKLRNNRLEAQHVNYKLGIWKGDPDFVVVFNSNDTSIIYRLRYKQVLLLAGNDVIASSPVGGAANVL